MLNLKEFIGSKYRVTTMEEYRGGGDLDDKHYMIVKGNRGDIVAWDDDTLEVTVYGTELPKPKDGKIPDRTHNLSLPIKLERKGWKVKNHYDDSFCFILPKDRIFEAVKAIKAPKTRHLSPEHRKKVLATLARIHANKKSVVPNAKPEDKIEISQKDTN